MNRICVHYKLTSGLSNGQIYNVMEVQEKQ